MLNIVPLGTVVEELDARIHELEQTRTRSPKRADGAVGARAGG